MEDFLQFYDHYLPALPLAPYKITVQQDVQALAKSFVQEQLFAIDGPRFLLAPDEVHAVFPPGNSQGLFERTLPHIVLTQRALPWERPLQPGRPEIPWLALLLCDTSELLVPASSAGRAVSPTRDRTMTVQQLLSPEAGVFYPTLTLQSYEDPHAPCRVIDLLPATFTKIVPRLGELPYLAHCRRVNTGNKITLGLHETGWFSVVVCNRFPPPPTPGQPGNVNLVHLVSLEGWQEYLGDNPAFPPGTTTLRLVSLASWAFTCLPEAGQSFASLAQGLAPAAGQAKTTLLLKLPVPDPGTPVEATQAQQIVHERLAAGYVPLHAQTRQGEQTWAWYRGPLTPVAVAPWTDRQPCNSALEAVRDDPTTGVADQSYGVAWQIGRLLALSDRSFAVNLLRWRQRAHRLIDLLYERLQSDNLPQLLDDPQAIQVFQRLLEPQLITQAWLDYLLADFLPHTAPGAASSSATPVPRAPAPSGSLPPNTQAELQTLLQIPQVQALLAELHDPAQDPTMAQMVRWLARLSLLYGMPFEHLVPAPQMLPPESIRFFYVDPNWLDCLVDGALSVGVHSSRDRLHTSILRDTLDDAVHEAVLQLRAQALGLSSSPGQALTGSMAGLLLRSALVSGWPGLEVRAFRQVEPGGQNPRGAIPALRLERLAPEVLLCLFPEVPAWVELNEPQEGLHFGMEDNQQVLLRVLGGSEVGQPLGQAVAVPWRSGSLVVDIAQLQSRLQTALQQAGQLASTDRLGPADFALHMVAAPEQMVFQNPQ